MNLTELTTAVAALEEVLLVIPGLVADKHVQTVQRLKTFLTLALQLKGEEEFYN